MDADIQKLYEAKGILCSYCTYDGCEWCQVERVISNVKAQLNEEEDNEL